MITKWPESVLAVAAATLVIGGGFGFGVFGAVSKESGFINKGAESNTVKDISSRDFDSSVPTAVAVVSPKDGSLKVTDARYKQEVERIFKDIDSKAGVDVRTYYSTNSPAFIAKDQTRLLATINLGNGSDEQKYERLEAFQGNVRSDTLQVQLGGELFGERQASEQVKKDLERAELVAFPLLAILLLVIFRGVIAALLPLILGGISIIGALIVIRMLTNFTEIDQYALNVVTILGLGLAVDYSLLMVNRFREELSQSSDKLYAIRRTMFTAGRTILFSGLTVMASLLALTIFPISFLRSVGIGGVCALAVAVVGSLTILPAVLYMLGKRIDMLRIGRVKTGPSRFWGHLAYVVMARPLVTAGITILLIVGAALPLRNIVFTGNDYRSLPLGSTARSVAETLRSDFEGQGENLAVIFPPDNAPGSAEGIKQTYELTKRLDDISGVTSVVSPTPIQNGVNAATYQSLYAGPQLPPALAQAREQTVAGDLVRLQVNFDGDASDAKAQQLVEDVRELREGRSDIQVGGPAAEFHDSIESILKGLPWALLLIGVSMFVLLSLLLRSLLIPLQAIFINTLALAISFSVLVLIFQEGHLTGAPTNFVHTSAIDLTLPILIFAIAFGLSMDYASFLYARMREEKDAGNSNELAIRRGVQFTGPIITAAAVLLFVVVAAFATSKIALLQEVGVGLSIAVLVDAFVVRIFLVPAIMKLCGKANWYAPKWMSRFAIKH